MKYKRNIFVALLCFCVLVGSVATTVFAHSGRTDGSGGHRDNRNKSGLGSYHYHCGGYPAHLHVNGYCPYRDKFPSKVTIKVEKTTLAIGEEVEISAIVSPKNACDLEVDWSSSDRNVAVVYDGRIVAKGYGTTTLTAETFNGKKKSVKITVKEIAAKKVSLAGMPDTLCFFIGESFKLEAITEPKKVDDPTMVWTSSEPEIATVAQDGTVKLLTAGTVTICATAVNGVYGTIKLEVQEKKVESVDIGPDKLDLIVGGSYQLTSKILPSDATYQNLAWNSDKPEIVTVSNKGLLEAHACGETVITASAVNGVSDRLTVSVTEIKAESLDVTGPNILIVDEIGQLQVTVIPDNATDQTVELWSDNPDILEISGDGVMVAKGVGKTVIHADQKDVNEIFEIEVIPIPVEKLTLFADIAGELQKGDTLQFETKIWPEEADPGYITWCTDDPEIAAIDTNGLLTVKGSGIVTVTAKTENGITAVYEVHIPEGRVYTMVALGGIALAAGAFIAYRIIHKRKKQ